MAASFQGFRSLIENSADAITLIDPQGVVLYASASNTTIFGYQPEELVGRNGWDLIHPDDRDRSIQAVQEVLATPAGPHQWAARIRHKNGTYCWVESTISNLLAAPEVQAIVLNYRDINARISAEVERQQQTEELALSNSRLEEFAYAAAHDLREPLRAISSFTEMLVRNTQMDANTRQMAQFIVDGAARMSTLVDDLLTFASTGMAASPRCVDLQQAVAQAVQNLALDIKVSGAIMTVDWLPVVQSNEVQLVRLFQNLISNSVKYRGTDPVKIHVTAELRESEWVVKIEDNGLGIALDDHARVFMPFIRLANRDVPGTGLGLAVCKKIVEGLGGAIWVESKLGAGATFCFTIMAAEEGTLVPLPSHVAAA
jgi:PAS domain S-box-containing protein